MVKEDGRGCCVLCGQHLPRDEAGFSKLTPVEAKIVSVLLNAPPGQYMKSGEISDRLYSDRRHKPAWANKSVTVHIGRIRTKLGQDCIQSRLTGGYRWATLFEQLELF